MSCLLGFESVLPAVEGVPLLLQVSFVLRHSPLYYIILHDGI